MLIYLDVLSKLKQAGYSSYRLRKEKIMGESKMQNIRDNKVSAETVDQLCQLLQCQPGDILKYVPDNQQH